MVRMNLKFLLLFPYRIYLLSHKWLSGCHCGRFGASAVVFQKLEKNLPIKNLSVNPSGVGDLYSYRQMTLAKFV